MTVFVSGNTSVAYKKAGRHTYLMRSFILSQKRVEI